MFECFQLVSTFLHGPFGTLSYFPVDIWDGMDPAAQLEFVRDNVDADMQFILGESGVSLENQVAIGRHYGTLRKFSALGDDRASIRTSCLQDFAIPGDTPASRAQTASVVAAWETAKEYMAKEIELKAEAKVLGQLGSFRSTRGKQC